MTEPSDTIDTVRQQMDELERVFELRWAADMRAIKRWREQAPGRELTMPDHADMVVHLLDEQERLQAKIERQDALHRALMIEADERYDNLMQEHAALLAIIDRQKAERCSLPQTDGEKFCTQLDNAVKNALNIATKAHQAIQPGDDR